MSDIIDYEKMFGLEDRLEMEDPDSETAHQTTLVDENLRRRKHMIEMHEKYEAKNKKSFYERSGVDNFYYSTGKGFSRKRGVQYYTKPPIDRSVRDIDALLYILSWMPMFLVMAITVGVCYWLGMPSSGYFYCLCMGAGLGMIVKYNLNDNMTFSQAAKHCMPALITLFVIMMLYTLGLITGVVQSITDQLLRNMEE
ncbi:MAG: hypothetical protein K6C68_04725 [Ruminococcus sp.]|nr:hypothetical protein [Ruminococcus sp.]